MKLVNETSIDGRALRSFLLACLRREGVDPAGYSIRVQWQRRNGRRLGTASWYGCRIRLLVERHDAPLPSALGASTVVKMAATMAHEVAHTRGVRHDEMAGGCYVSLPMGEWARGIAIPLRAPRPKPTKDQRVSARLSVIEERLAEWQRKLKLARTKVRKYEAAQRRAGVRLAALRAQPSAQ